MASTTSSRSSASLPRACTNDRNSDEATAEVAEMETAKKNTIPTFFIPEHSALIKTRYSGRLGQGGGDRRTTAGRGLQPGLHPGVAGVRRVRPDERRRGGHHPDDVPA